MRKHRGMYQKSVDFDGKQLKLYSIDGVTWSSSKSEIKQMAVRSCETRNSIYSNLGGASSDEK